MITLRPHHILCIHNYKGKGYSDEFVKNMDNIVEELRNNSKTEVKIVYSTDDLCGRCPNKLGEDLCVSNTKVKLIDNKVVEYLKVKEDIYTYEELVQASKKVINQKVMSDICGSCEWYKNGTCKDISESDL